MDHQQLITCDVDFIQIGTYGFQIHSLKYDTFDPVLTQDWMMSTAELHKSGCPLGCQIIVFVLQLFSFPPFLD